MDSTWRKMLKIRCVDCTNYEKIVQTKTIDNSMLNYARGLLNDVVYVETEGKTMVAA